MTRASGAERVSTRARDGSMPYPRRPTISWADSSSTSMNASTAGSASRCAPSIVFTTGGSRRHLSRTMATRRSESYTTGQRAKIADTSKDPGAEGLASDWWPGPRVARPLGAEVDSDLSAKIRTGDSCGFDPQCQLPHELPPRRRQLCRSITTSSSWFFGQTSRRPDHHHPIK